MIKAAVFDFDGVVYIEGELFSIRFSRDYGIPLEKIAPFFENEFQKCLLGQADLKEELKKYLPKWGWKQNVNSFLDYWFDRGGQNQDVAGLVRDMRKSGIKCILCTNNEKYRVSWLRKKLRLDDAFDEILASYKIGAKKPDIEVFEKVIEVTGLMPEEIMFCDDDKEHIAAAKKYGMTAVMFKGAEHLKKELHERGILKAPN